MEYIAFDGRCVLSRPGEYDGLIRGWLSRQGWRAPTHVKDGRVYVPDSARAKGMEALLDAKWDGAAPRPAVEIYGR